MLQQDREAAYEFELLGVARAVDFLGDDREIGLANAAGAQQLRLFRHPGIKIGVLQRVSGGHAGKLMRCRPRVETTLFQCAA